MSRLEQIGLYKQLVPFTNEGAGMSEWCIAEKMGVKYFVKKFLSPVYPSKELGLPEKKYQSRVVKFHAAEESRKAMYRALRENDTSGTLVVPVEVINYQYHICTIAEYIVGNVSASDIYKLSEWQRLVLMRTLTLALINVHRAGVVHSDMKPENVLITQNPENGSCALKLIDFDGSFMASNPPKEATGDPAFFAPEAYALVSMPGIRLDKRIDVFALGIILHYFWTGKFPERDSNETIGQCILKGESVKLDSSIPEQLRAIIERSLEGNPDKRIGEEEIYNELEKILPSYPVKIINLQEGRKKKTASTGTRRNSTTHGTEATKSMSVPVMHCDKEGHTLRSHSIEIAYGGRGAAYAEKIPGYHIISSRERIEVSVDKEGNASEYPIRFTYEKDKKESNGGKTFFIVLLILGLIYCIAMYAAANNYLSSGDYEQAKQYMELFPFYKDIFREKWDETNRQIQIIQNRRNEQMRIDNYNQAVSYYRNGYYEDAYYLFDMIENSYSKTKLYKDFCLAHMNWPPDYYTTIYNNIGFEDAPILLAYNDQMFCQYMVGTWTAKSSSNGSQTVTMIDNGNNSYTVNNLPEMGDGYTFYVSNGSFYVTKKNSSSSYEHFTISIKSKNSFEMYSLQTKTRYQFTKN